MAEFEQEKQQVQRAPTATAPTATSAEGAMHETRMNVTRHRRAAMRKAEGQDGAGPKVDIPEGGGKALDGGVKKSMEQKLGADLSGVKIHTGGDSAGAANKLNARAFTVGSDVHFNAGEFNPGSKEGTKLLAHELTHVVQQGATSASGVQAKLTVGAPDDEYEQEADQVARQVMRQEQATVQRQPEEDPEEEPAEEPAGPAGGTPGVMQKGAQEEDKEQQNHD